MSLTEADLKRAVIDYLEYGMNQGKWWFTRLNSGKAFVKRGGKEYMIQLCDEGTSDLLVVKQGKAIFIELKSTKGKQSPAQGAFQKLIQMQGASYSIVHSLEELEELLGI